MRSRKRMLLRASRCRISAATVSLNTKREAEQLGGDLPRHVIRRRAKAAGNQKDVATGKGIEQRSANGRPVRNGCLSADPQPEREKLLAEISEVGVGDVAKQEFRAGIKDLDVHRAAGLVFSSMPPFIASRDSFGESDRVRAARKPNSPFSRKGLDPSVDSRVLVEVFSQVVNVEKIRQHAQKDLSRRRGFQMRGA